MDNFFKKNYGKILLVILFSVLAFVVLHSKTMKDKITEERIVESITLNDKQNSMYFKFVDDDFTYVVYESYGIDFSVFNDLNVNDKVSISFEDGKKVKYHIIYDMTYNGEKLFDVYEYAWVKGASTKEMIGVFCISSALICAIFIPLSYLVKKEINSPDKFIIKAGDNMGKNGNRNTLMLFSILGFSPLAGFIWIIFRYIENEYWHITTSMIVIVSMFLFIAILGIFVCLYEKFEFNGSEYSYRHFYGKKETISLDDISKVEIKRKKLFKIIFYDKLGKEKLKFYDDGTAFTDNVFIPSLQQNNIQIIAEKSTMILDNPEETLRYFESIKDKDEKLNLIYQIAKNECEELNELINSSDMVCDLDYDDTDGEQFYCLSITNKEFTRKNMFFCSLQFDEHWMVVLNDKEEEIDATNLSNSEIIELFIKDINEYKAKKK